MPKKVYTPEERKAIGERLKAAREAKNLAEQGQKEPQRISPATAAAGIMQPEGGLNRRGTLIPQISFEEAENDLDELGVDGWIRKHYDAKDFNLQSMAEVLRESTEDIYNRLHAMGYELPDGTYSVG